MLNEFREQMNSRFAGKKEIVEHVLQCFLAGGHVLLEDVPGVGKTTLARTFAKSLGLSFGRIQFTPDTMPSDVTGLSVYNMKTGEFSYREGAVMKNILLADELNRTSPKTQAALLEAMAEAQVTVDGTVYPLPSPFMVIATQNPVSFTGTFPLPEAQLDRFMMRLTVGYPDREAEQGLVRAHMEGKYEEEIRPVLNREDVIELRRKTMQVQIADPVIAYAQEIVAKIREGNGFALGASPRSLIQLLMAARAKAFLEGRDFVKPDDIKQLVSPVLSHRLMLTSEMKLQKKTAEDLLGLLMLKVSVPVE